MFLARAFSLVSGSFADEVSLLQIDSASRVALLVTSDAKNVLFFVSLAVATSDLITIGLMQLV